MNFIPGFPEVGRLGVTEKGSRMEISVGVGRKMGQCGRKESANLDLKHHLPSALPQDT